MHTLLIYSNSKQTRQKVIDDLIKSLLSTELTSDYLSDVLFIDKEENKKSISIDQVRKAIDYIKIKPVNSPYKIIIINDAQNITIEGQNALLKIIEEPPEYAQIVLSVNSIDNVLPTIKSRCILINADSKIPINSNDTNNLVKKDDIKQILSSDLGTKIDWLTENKQNFSNSEWVNELLTVLETQLRHYLLNISKREELNNENKKLEKLLVQSIRNTHLVKERTQIYNANAFLNIEALLVKLPRLKI